MTDVEIAQVFSILHKKMDQGLPIPFVLFRLDLEFIYSTYLFYHAIHSCPSYRISWNFPWILPWFSHQKKRGSLRPWGPRAITFAITLLSHICDICPSILHRDQDFTKGIKPLISVPVTQEMPWNPEGLPICFYRWPQSLMAAATWRSPGRKHVFLNCSSFACKIYIWWPYETEKGVDLQLGFFPPILKWPLNVENPWITPWNWRLTKYSPPGRACTTLEPLWKLERPQLMLFRRSPKLFTMAQCKIWMRFHGKLL